MIGKTDTFQKSLAIELEEVEPGFSQSEPQASSACKPSHDSRGEVGKPSTPPTSIPASTLSNQSADTKKSHDQSDSGHQDSDCSARECESLCSEPRVIKSDAATDDIVDITQSQDSAFAKSDGDLVESVAVAEASSSPTNAPLLELTKPRTADSENKINEKEGSPGTSGNQLRKPKFVKSRRVTEETRFYPSATSTPYHGNVYKPSPPRRIVHSIRPVTGITAVRLNRTYELRFTENHEKKCLIDARRVSYKLYMSTARVLKRIPTIELGAGFP